MKTIRWIFLIGVGLMILIWIALQIITFIASKQQEGSPGEQQAALENRELLEGTFFYDDNQWYFRSNEEEQLSVLFLQENDQDLLDKEKELDVLVFGQKQANQLEVDQFTILGSTSPQDHRFIRDFVSDYIRTIQEGDYQKLAEFFWLPGVEKNILEACGNPLGAQNSASAQQAWSICGSFENLTIRILGIDDRATSSIVNLQFFDEDNQPVGAKIHPEWDSGHTMEVLNTPEGLKTADWQFFR